MAIEPRVSPYYGYPPLSAIGSAIIEVYGAPSDPSDVWNTVKWDEVGWAGVGWLDATPQSMNCQITWGTDDPAGALSIPAAGSWSVFTYDPQRILDPSNTNSPVIKYLRPGGMVRIMLRHDGTDDWVRKGFIDTVEFDLATLQGSIRATDGVSVLVKTKLPAGLAHDPSVPLTLRARARWALAKAQVTYMVVEADPPGKLDPAVGLPLDEEASVWQQISAAALDALYGVWLDRTGLLRFRYYGDNPNTGVLIGGNLYDSIPVETITPRVSLDGMINHVVAKGENLDSEAGYTESLDQTSIDLYGDLALQRDRANPDGWPFTYQLVQDLGQLHARYDLATIRPQHTSQLLKLLDLGIADNVRIRTDKTSPVIDVDAHVLGGSFEANTESGWSVGLQTYQPANGWYGPPLTRQARYYSNKSSEIWTTKAGAVFGQADSATGQMLQSNFVAPTDEMHAVLLDFPAISWTGIAKLIRATLRVNRPYHQDLNQTVQMREEGWLKVQRITAAWAEADVWPGPAITGTNEAGYYYIADDLSKWVEIDVTTIVRAWAPATVLGGGAQTKYGIKVAPYWPTGGGVDPEHFMFSMKLSSQPAYLYLKME